MPRIPITAAQSRVMAAIAGADYELDPLGSRGKPGPLLCDFGRWAIKITEDGRCELVAVEFAGAVE